MNLKLFKEFLMLFQYGIDDEKKKESIKYILDRMNEASTNNKILEFDKLQDVDYLPNPFVDGNGKLLFNTKTIQLPFDEYLQKTKFVKTEVANLVIENYKILKDIANKPLVEEESDD